MGEIIERRCWWIVAAIAASGLTLRVAAAQGGLWLDEAWSAVMAADAATPLGIFLHINHDNNHHLNSLWLQFVGLDAHPLLARALSIASGSATILVAARVGRRRTAGIAILAALFFALSPLFVTYGSEARGYAPMLLAFMIALDLVDRWLTDQDRPPPALALAIAAMLGLLAQLTMAFGVAALGIWTIWVLRDAKDGRLRTLARLWCPATIAAAIALLLVFVPAWAVGGMALGASEPFTLRAWAAGLEQAFGYGLGSAWAALVVIPAGLLLGVPRGRLAMAGYSALISAPALVLLAQLPNAGVARLYLTAAAGALLLFALLLGNAFAQGKRVLPLLFAVATIGIMALASATVVKDRRADPAQALAAIASRAPMWADIAVDRSRSEAILKAASRSARYALALRQSCPPARFLFIERDGDEPFPLHPRHCNSSYSAIAGDTVQGLSGTQWKLYERSDR